MSMNATVSSSSATICPGSSPATILQNRQSGSLMAGSLPALASAGGRSRSPPRARRPRRRRPPPRARAAARRAADPGRIPSAATSSSPRIGGRGGSAVQSSASRSSWRASSRCRAIARSELSPRVASRSATLSTVTSACDGAARVQVAVDLAPIQRHRGARGSRAGGGGGSGRPRTRPAASSPAAGSGSPPTAWRPASSWPHERDPPLGRHGARLGLGDVVQQRRRNAAPRRASVRSQAAPRAAPARRSA